MSRLFERVGRAPAVILRWFFSTLHKAAWEPTSPVPLAVFRVAFAVILFAELLYVINRRQLFFLQHPLIDEIPRSVIVHLWIWGAAIIALGFGAFTPVAAVVNYWFVMRYFVNGEFVYHVDLLYLPTSLLFIVLPSYRTWSVDNLIVKRLLGVDMSQSPIPRFYHTLPIYWVMGFMYFDSTLYKLQSPFWLHGLGFWLPASFPQFTVWSWNSLLNQEYLVKVAGYITLWFELSFIFVFWIARLRKFLLPIGVVLHLGIAIVLPLPLFGLFMVISYILFFPDDTMNRWLDIVWTQLRRLRPMSTGRSHHPLPSAALIAPNKPFLALDRVLVRALLVVMLGVTVVQSNITFERRIFSSDVQQYMAPHLGLFTHRVFGQWQFTAMTNAVAIVYYDAQGNEQWLPWNRSDGHVGSGAYSRFWTWWWLVALPGNPGRNDACARIAEEWATRNRVPLETGRVVIKVRPLIGGHFWEKDRQKTMEEIPWTDAATITWFDGQRRFDWPSPEQRRMMDDPPPELYLPLDAWREVGDQKPGERYLLDGWSWPESWGRWSTGRRVQLAIPQAGELGLATTVRLDVVSYTTKKAPVQPYRILMGETLLGEGVLGPEGAVISFVVPANLNTKRTMVIDISVPKAQVAKDGRQLAVGLKRIFIARGVGHVGP